MSCVPIVLENGDVHPIKANAVCKNPSLSNVSLVVF
jgi:hypothetical protein